MFNVIFEKYAINTNLILYLSIQKHKFYEVFNFNFMHFEKILFQTNVKPSITRIKYKYNMRIF